VFIEFGFYMCEYQPYHSYRSTL